MLGLICVFFSIITVVQRLMRLGVPKSRLYISVPGCEPRLCVSSAVGLDFKERTLFYLALETTLIPSLTGLHYDLHRRIRWGFLASKVQCVTQAPCGDNLMVRDTERGDEGLFRGLKREHCGNHISGMPACVKWDSLGNMGVIWSSSLTDKRVHRPSGADFIHQCVLGQSVWRTDVLQRYIRLQTADLIKLINSDITVSVITECSWM